MQEGQRHLKRDRPSTDLDAHFALDTFDFVALHLLDHALEHLIILFVQNFPDVFAKQLAGRGFEPGFPPGEVHSGELAFYPSGWPQRAIVPDTLTHVNEPIKHPPGGTRLEDFAAHYARALAAQPWLAHFPAMLTDVRPVAQNDQFWIGDTTARMLPLSLLHNTGWQLLALSGGNPITLFGEWDGSVLSPLSVWSEGRFVLL